jgi:hypothetical protein
VRGRPAGGGAALSSPPPTSPGPAEPPEPTEPPEPSWHDDPAEIGPTHSDHGPITVAGPGRPPRRLLRGCITLQYLIGRQLLVGITIRDDQGAVVGRRQFHGLVTEVTDGVVVVAHDEGETLLPADPDAYRPAEPGTYRLASGVTVVDPDHLTTWDVLPGAT